MNTSDRSTSPVIVALDYQNRDDVVRLVGRLKPGSCRLKIGFELFSAEGPALVRTLVDKGFDVFLDLKYHDIPNTVLKACRAAADLGVWMLNVHALGGSRMMLAAREGVESSANNPLLIAVTVLTSHSAEDLTEIGLADDPANQVNRLAGLAMGSGMDGVVCSGQEAKQLRAAHPESLLVTPGIRLDSGGPDDQRRIMTPVEAMAAGASYLVIGRPITQALDPAGALDYINSTVLT